MARLYPLDAVVASVSGRMDSFLLRKSREPAVVGVIRAVVPLERLSARAPAPPALHVGTLVRDSMGVVQFSSRLAIPADELEGFALAEERRRPLLAPWRSEVCYGIAIRTRSFIDFAPMLGWRPTTYRIWFDDDKRADRQVALSRVRELTRRLSWLNEELATSIDRFRAIARGRNPGTLFEQAIAAELRRLGLAPEHVGGSGDGGADLLVDLDGESVIVQCKFWADLVGSPSVRHLIGALVTLPAGRGILVGYSGFTRQAIEVAKRRVLLLTAQELIGVATRSELSKRLRAVASDSHPAEG